MLALYGLACLVGLALLARSSDALVLGSSSLAARLGVPPVVVGVVVIGFGTSAPELLVSGTAAATGAPALAVGNVIGSNIANLTLVLGVAALIAPVTVRVAVVRREVPVVLLATVGFGLAVQDGVTRVEASALLAALAGSLTLLLRRALRDRGTAPDPATGGADELTGEVEEFLEQEGPSSVRGLAVRTAMGLLGTLAAAQALVWGAAGVAHVAGLSEGFIGVTVVAVGTSIPELVTAAQAARHAESDLIVGNLLGSNLFNALAVGGLIGLVRPGASVGPPLTTTGVLVMIGVSVLAVAFMVRGFQVVRWEAATLVAVFAGCLPLLAGG